MCKKPKPIIFLFLFLSSTVQVHAQAEKFIPRTTVPRILFVGNSFTFGAGSPVQSYRPQHVTDLNGTDMGGVSSLFKAFVQEAGREFDVSMEASPGKNFDFHYLTKREIIGRQWDYVVLQGYSVLDNNKPGDPTLLIAYTKKLAQLFKEKNSEVDIWLLATWSRADIIYTDSSLWYGQPIEKMALDIRQGYNLAMKECPEVRGIIPVGEAWNRAMKEQVADPNPYDGITAGQMDLWTADNYHASAYGYYLEALMVFGSITSLDPRSLGERELAARELGFSREQAVALQKVAYEELLANDSARALKSFIPKTDKSD